MSQIHHTALIGRVPEHRDYLRNPERKFYSVKLGEGIVVQPFVTVDGGIERPTQIGDNCLLLTKCHVGHDALVGNGVEIATGAIIGGHCQIGDGVKIGLNATIKPFVKIGAGARIGMGAVVICDVPAGRVFAGNPARDLRPPATDSELVKTCC